MFDFNGLEKIYDLRHSSSVIALTDSENSFINEFNTNYKSDPVRHGGANFLFCDGHVQLLMNIEREYAAAGKRGRWTSRSDD